MKIFLDTNIVVWYLKGRRDIVDLVNSIEKPYSNIIVFLESLYVYRKVLLRANKPLKLEPVLDFFKEIDLLPIEPLDINEITNIVKEYNIQPNDALIALTCKHYGIDTIATLDEDFKRIPWLKTIP